MKTVSIIVPVYNVENYLRRCLDSIANQTLRNFECIIVNDGSPDNSQTIIDEYVAKYPTIFKSVIKENGGLSDARNLGITYATANYIGFIDSDDYIEPMMFENLYQIALSEQADISVCDFSMDYEVSHVSHLIKGLRSIDKNPKKNLLISPGSSWNKLYKKELFIKYNITYPVGLWYEDLATTGKLILHSETIAYVDMPLLHYIQREGSIMSSLSSKIFDIYTAVESIENYYRQHGEYERYKKEIEYLYIENLALYASLRFLNLPSPDDEREVMKIIVYMKQKFPNWIKNPYIRTLSKKDIFTLYLLQMKLVKLLKFLISLSRKVKK